MTALKATMHRFLSGSGGNSKRDPRALSHGAVHLEDTTQHLGPLADQFKPQAVPLQNRIGIESLAVVIHTDPNTVLPHVERDFDQRGLAVASGVSKQFLDGAKEHYFQVRLEATV